MGDRIFMSDIAAIEDERDRLAAEIADTERKLIAWIDPSQMELFGIDRIIEKGKQWVQDLQATITLKEAENAELRRARDELRKRRTEIDDEAFEYAEQLQKAQDRIAELEARVAELEPEAALVEKTEDDGVRWAVRAMNAEERLAEVEQAVRDALAVERRRMYQGCPDCDELPDCSNEAGCPRAKSKTQKTLEAALKGER